MRYSIYELYDDHLHNKISIGILFTGTGHTINDPNESTPNLAFNKRVIMSSVTMPFIGDSCVDGYLSTMCHTNHEARPYIWIDLGKSYAVRRIDIFNRNGYGNDLEGFLLL